VLLVPHRVGEVVDGARVAPEAVQRPGLEEVAGVRLDLARELLVRTPDESADARAPGDEALDEPRADAPAGPDHDVDAHALAATPPAFASPRPDSARFLNSSRRVGSEVLRTYFTMNPGAGMPGSTAFS